MTIYLNWVLLVTLIGFSNWQVIRKTIRKEIIIQGSRKCWTWNYFVNHVKMIKTSHKWPLYKSKCYWEREVSKNNTIFGSKITLCSALSYDPWKFTQVSNFLLYQIFSIFEFFSCEDFDMYLFHTIHERSSTKGKVQFLSQQGSKWLFSILRTGIILTPNLTYP